MYTIIPPVFLICESESYWAPLFRRSLASESVDVGQQSTFPSFPLDENVSAVGLSVNEENTAQVWSLVRQLHADSPALAIVVLGDSALSFALCPAGVCLPVTAPLNVPGACRYIVRNAERRSRTERSESLLPQVNLPWHAAGAK